MKTPEQIQLALSMCKRNSCNKTCPYHGEKACYVKLHSDAGIALRQLERELEAAQPKWISVEERLPDKFGVVLICVYGHVTIAWYSVNRFETGGGMVFFVDDHFADGNEVTHWMPLPQPPKEESYGTKGTVEVKPHVRPARGE